MRFNKINEIKELSIELWNLRLHPGAVLLQSAPAISSHRRDL